MKTIRNLFGALLALAAVAAFHACEDEVEYAPAELPGNAQVYFPSTNETTFRLSKTGNSFDVTIMRANTDEASSVSITATCESPNYTIPASANFAQGEDKAAITITYNADAMEYDDFTEITLSIADESATTPYGVSQYTFTAGIPAPWKSLGMATYVEDFVTTFFGAGNPAYEVEIQENELQRGYYRLVNPYGAAYPNNEEGDWDTSQDYFLEIHAEDPTAVYIDVQPVGMDWGYGMFYMGSLAGYYMSQGSTLAEQKEAGNTGVLEDGVITFPPQTLLVRMADYQEGGLYKANGSGAFRVALPGVVLADYGLSVAYNGKYTDAKGNDAGVLAKVSEMGADLESVRLAVVPGTDLESAVEAISNGSVEYKEVRDTAIVMLPFAETPAEGRYMIVAVGYAGNAAEATASAQFTYEAPSSETWTAIGTGDYTYTLFFGSEDEPAVDEGLALYRSDEDATRYKIEHWGYDVDFIFTYNPETGEVVVEDQEVGYTDDTYGVVMVDDLADYIGSTEMGYSYYADGVFHFAVVYYVSEGELAYGEETFAWSGEAAAAIRSTIHAGKQVKAAFGQWGRQLKMKQARPVFPVKG